MESPIDINDVQEMDVEMDLSRESEFDALVDFRNIFTQNESLEAPLTPSKFPLVPRIIPTMKANVKRLHPDVSSHEKKKKANRPVTRRSLKGSCAKSKTPPSIQVESDLEVKPPRKEDINSIAFLVRRYLRNILKPTDVNFMVKRYDTLEKGGGIHFYSEFIRSLALEDYKIVALQKGPHRTVCKASDAYMRLTFGPRGRDLDCFSSTHAVN